MPQLFRRRSGGLADPAGPDEAVIEPDTDLAEADAQAAETEAEEVRRPRGYTPSKKELGKATPKRPSPHVRRPGTAPAAKSRKDLTKEEKQELREARRARRREITEGMRRGDPQFLSARDQGPERALARDVVDSRRTVGTWFFGGALVVLIGSSSAIAEAVLVANALFVLLALALTVDSVLLCRKAKKLIRQRHPESTARMGSLYLYIVMRSITFRRMRVPLPRKNIGEPV